MDDIVEAFIIFLIVVTVAFCGYFVIYSLNLTGTAVGQYSAEFCDKKGCAEDEKTVSGYLYPGDTMSCPPKASIFRYFILVGKVSVPQYETYYLKEGTCEITPLTPTR
jgi:hypothetical protein